MSTFTKDLGKNLFIAFIGASVTVIMPLLLTCFIHKSAVINVGELIQTNGKIALSVTISNFNNQIINDMEIYFPDDINLLNIQSNANLTIKNINNGIQINSLLPNSTQSFILTVNKSFNIGDLKINNPQNKYTLNLLNKEKPISSTIIINAIISGIIYLILYLIAIAVIYKMLDVHSKRQIEKVQSLKEEQIEKVQSLKEEVNKVKEESNQYHQSNEKYLLQNFEKLSKTERDYHKLRIYYITRMGDYAKELDFWKDTIRKILYQSNYKIIESNKLIELVTESLKTYGVKKNIDTHYDELQYLASQIREKTEE